jgi:hypothetical protein
MVSKHRLGRRTGSRSRGVSGRRFGQLIGGKAISCGGTRMTRLYCDYYRHRSTFPTIVTVYSPALMNLAGANLKVYRPFRTAIHLDRPGQQRPYTCLYEPAFASLGPLPLGVGAL